INWIWAGGTIFHLRENVNGPDLATLQVRGNQPPNITLTAPVNGSAAMAPATVVVSANASDPDGSVQRVEFWGDGSLIK
ncbi:Ig-like domain-containing protein, partial [Frateuria sp. Soil773]|uniref:Ig-like domain-containing protein n=1 Tax=Frateuria sp. Soil773 TaxID=1736407 RepID=UPI00138F33F5